MKNKIFFECVECGYQSPKYYGKCPQCDSWNSMVELKSTEQELKGEREPLKPQSLDEISQKNFESIVTGFDEFDRVLGGGIVPGSVVLIGGEPGVGKSTLLLDVSGILAQNKKKVLYYSGEESASQIKLIAERLCVNSKDIFILTIGTLEDLKQSIDDIKPDFLIVDSIQTINSQKSKVMSGSISVLRFVTSQLIEIAKKNDMIRKLLFLFFLLDILQKRDKWPGQKPLNIWLMRFYIFKGRCKPTSGC